MHMRILIYGGTPDLPDLPDWDVEIDPVSSWKSWRKSWLKIYVTAITAIGFKVTTAEICLQMWVFIGSMLGNRVYISWYSFLSPFRRRIRVDCWQLSCLPMSKLSFSVWFAMGKTELRQLFWVSCIMLVFRKHLTLPFKMNLFYVIAQSLRPSDWSDEDEE